MKSTRSLLWLFCLLIPFLTYAQKQAVSAPGSYSIKPKVEPPILSLVEGSLKFTDVNGNNAIDAQEECSIQFALKNSGFGDGLNITALIQIQGSTTGILIEKKMTLPKIPVNNTTQILIPLSSDMNTQNGNITIKISVTEPNGFDVQPFSLNIETRSFQAPEVRITDFAISGEGKLEALKPFTLQLMLQNTGQGCAENITTNITLPENILVLKGEASQTFKRLEPGESRTLEYSLIINARYTASSVPVTLSIREKQGKFAQNWNQAFELNQSMSSPGTVMIQAAAAEHKNIETASFKSDVDRDIPVSNKHYPNRYALIIGNEDYASRSGNLNKAINVDFAQQDARVFAQYMQSTFGVPVKNIKLLVNATTGEMQAGIAWLENNARAYGADVELYFYYSGHGLPDDADKIPYLIPVDISGEKPELGISLHGLYSKLSQNPAHKITVLLDACFSGGARNQELIARKGVRVQPKSGNIPGNIVVFSSSTGNQSSAVFREKQHGFFTYFLLKGIQSKGSTATYGSLFEWVQREVDIEVSRRGMLQQPQIQNNSELGESWKNWSIN